MIYFGKPSEKLSPIAHTFLDESAHIQIDLA